MRDRLLRGVLPVPMFPLDCLARLAYYSGVFNLPSRKPTPTTMPQAYSDPRRSSDPHALPDVEVNELDLTGVTFSLMVWPMDPKAEGTLVAVDSPERAAWMCPKKECQHLVRADADWSEDASPQCGKCGTQMIRCAAVAVGDRVRVTRHPRRTADETHGSIALPVAYRSCDCGCGDEWPIHG